MFGRNRAVQVKFVNTKKEAMKKDEPVIEKTVDPAEIAKIATEYTVKTIGALGAVIAAHKVLNTTCEVIVIAAKAKFK
jgi:hypothetical protein